jgi:uncharacterized protein (DUF2237 family)
MYRYNVYGQPLVECSVDPITGWSRNGKCEYYLKDKGMHLVCGRVSDKFLNFTFGKGNNLYSLGLKDGDYWCFCVHRWIEAYKYDPSIAPKIKLESTDIKVLEYIPSNLLLKYKI